jgi:hypothetical protein
LRCRFLCEFRLPVLLGRFPWRRAFVVAALIALLAAAGFAGWRIVLRPVIVEVASVSTDVPVQVFGLGTVSARVQSNVGFKVAGVLVAWTPIPATTCQPVACWPDLMRVRLRHSSARPTQACFRPGRA